jgi:hypothetical protein
VRAHVVDRVDLALAAHDGDRGAVDLDPEGARVVHVVDRAGPHEPVRWNSRCCRHLPASVLASHQIRADARPMLARPWLTVDIRPPPRSLRT